MDPIIEQAAAAAETPANGAPAPVAPTPAPTTTPEARRQDIMLEKDYWSDGPKTRALRDEMKLIIDSNPDAPAPATVKKPEAAPLPNQTELRLAEIRNLLTDRTTPDARKG